MRVVTKDSYFMLTGDTDQATQRETSHRGGVLKWLAIRATLVKCDQWMWHYLLLTPQSAITAVAELLWMVLMRMWNSTACRVYVGGHSVVVKTEPASNHVTERPNNKPSTGMLVICSLPLCGLPMWAQKLLAQIFIVLKNFWELVSVVSRCTCAQLNNAYVFVPTLIRPKIKDSSVMCSVWLPSDYFTFRFYIHVHFRKRKLPNLWLYVATYDYLKTKFFLVCAIFVNVCNFKRFQIGWNDRQSLKVISNGTMW